MTHAPTDDPLPDPPPPGWLERFVANPGAVATLLIAIIGQALFTGYFQIRHNFATDAAIANVEMENQHQSTAIAALDRLLTARIDALDAGGSRQMQLVMERQNRNIDAITKLTERINALEMLRTQIELMKQALSRLEDQQMRMIQAIDNTYNTVQELARGQGPARKPMPNEGKP